MDWKQFFDLKVFKVQDGQKQNFFNKKLNVPDQFVFSQLMMERFHHLRLSSQEKKKFSIGLRKILLSHHHFLSPEFHRLCSEFRSRILNCSQKELVFSTQAGGIYLFLFLLQEPIPGKKITCYTSELPLPILSAPSDSWIQFVYSPHQRGYLSDISTLWKESELMSLFELKDFKASA